MKSAQEEAEDMVFNSSGYSVDVQEAQYYITKARLEGALFVIDLIQRCMGASGQDLTSVLTEVVRKEFTPQKQ